MLRGAGAGLPLQSAKRVDNSEAEASSSSDEALEKDIGAAGPAVATRGAAKPGGYQESGSDADSSDGSEDQAGTRQDARTATPVTIE